MNDKKRKLIRGVILISVPTAVIDPFGKTQYGHLVTGQIFEHTTLIGIAENPRDGRRMAKEFIDRRGPEVLSTVAPGFHGELLISIVDGTPLDKELLP